MLGRTLLRSTFRFFEKGPFAKEVVKKRFDDDAYVDTLDEFKIIADDFERCLRSGMYDCSALNNEYVRMQIKLKDSREASYGVGPADSGSSEKKPYSKFGGKLHAESMEIEEGKRWFYSVELSDMKAEYLEEVQAGLKETIKSLEVEQEIVQRCFNASSENLQPHHSITFARSWLAPKYFELAKLKSQLLTNVESNENHINNGTATIHSLERFFGWFCPYPKPAKTLESSKRMPSL